MNSQDYLGSMAARREFIAITLILSSLRMKSYQIDKNSP
jgi:hypothetical protein